jgi:hypothetical protein
MSADPEDLFNAEALAHYRSARDLPSQPLALPPSWLRVTPLLTAAVLAAAVCFFFFGQFTRYLEGEGTVSSLSDRGSLVVRVPVGLGEAMLTSGTARWLTPDGRPAVRSLRVEGSFRWEGSEMTVRVRPDSWEECVRERVCIEGSRLALEAPAGERRLLNLLVETQ